MSRATVIDRYVMNTIYLIFLIVILDSFRGISVKTDIYRHTYMYLDRLILYNR